MLDAALVFGLLVLSLVLVLKSADYAIQSSTRVARAMMLPRYVIGFLVVAVIAILPETLISISAALKGNPAFGVATLFGSNIADLTLIFALVVLFAGRNLAADASVVRNRFWYVAIIAAPILLGFDGSYTRTEGFVLIALGALFYFFILSKARHVREEREERFSMRDLGVLAASMAALLIGAHLTVKYGIDFAHAIHLSPILIGMLVIGLGTTLPELFFAIKATRNRHDGLALGDILGTVVADATIVIGLVIAVHPFSIEPKIIYVTGLFMVAAMGYLMRLLSTGRKLTKIEALYLLCFYLAFVATEFMISSPAMYAL